MDVHHNHRYVVEAVAVSDSNVEGSPGNLTRGCTRTLADGAYSHDVVLLHHVPDTIRGQDEARVSFVGTRQSGDVRHGYASLRTKPTNNEQLVIDRLVLSFTLQNDADIVSNDHSVASPIS